MKQRLEEEQNLIRAREAGFSLVELIVTVAIIGILSALVVPAYDKISLRVSEAGAKVLLSGLAASEKSFYAEFLGYHSSFQALGFAPEGSTIFNVGFGDVGVVPTSANGFNTNVDYGLYNTLYYCDWADGTLSGVPNSCLIKKGYNGTFPPGIDPSFTVTATDFFATAVTDIPDSLGALEKQGQNLYAAIFYSAALAGPSKKTEPKAHLQIIINSKKQWLTKP